MNNKTKFKIISIDCCRCRAVDSVKAVKVAIGITGRDLCISALTEIQVGLKAQAEEEDYELDSFEFYNTMGWKEDMNEWFYDTGEESHDIIIGEGHPWWDKIDSHENWDEKEQEEFEEWVDDGNFSGYQLFEIV